MSNPKRSAKRTLLILTIAGFIAAIITGLVANSWRNKPFADEADAQAAADMAATSTLLMTWAGVGVVGLLVVWAVTQQLKAVR